MQDDCFNDTFDEWSFTTSGGVAIPSKMQSLSSNKSVKFSISLDDSAFLNDSFSFTTQQNDSLKEDSVKLTQLSQPTQNKSTQTHNEDKNRIFKDTIASNIEERLNLRYWGLPDAILQKYEARNVKKMFIWQVECLSIPKLLSEYKNLVYSAPTSAGKTLVAEIVAIKTVLEREKKVLFILPFVSVVREKMFYFQDIFGTSGVRVEGFMGSYNPPGGFKGVNVAICTIEKANSLINRLMEEGKLQDIGAVIVDEMHLLGDYGRGYLLELLLTKLRYMCLKNDEINIQIVGMSATLPNLDLLSRWLDAELYTTSFRPIPLNELCHLSGEIFDNSLQLIRKLEPLEELDTDTDNILQLCLETIRQLRSVLIFCPTKNWCENLAQQIAAAFWKLCVAKTQLADELVQALNKDAIIECQTQLKCCPAGLDQVLGKTINFGVAFHHAGLTMDERDIIEGGFREGSIRVLIATSTLSSGVNLPARTVIIRTPMFNGKPLNALVYRQMIGRAGRMGKDTEGESILICQKNNFNIAKELLTANLQPVESCLSEGRINRAILEVIASNVASTIEEIELFSKCTLLSSENEENSDFVNPIKETIDYLIEKEFIRLQDGSNKYLPTPLAKACLSSSLPPEEGLALLAELDKARQCFVLDTELHLVYTVTPYTVCNQLGNIDWMLYLNLWEKLSANMRRVGDLVGVKISFIVNGTRGRVQTSTAKSFHQLQVHKRFYTALALQDLVNEMPLNEVAAKFNCNRGMLQALQQHAASFAGMVTAFTKQLGWFNVELLVSQFQDRLQFGISRDLLDLMRLPLLNGQRARALFNAGIESLVDLAAVDVYELEIALRKARPFEKQVKEGESEFEAKKRNQMRSVWVNGRQGLTEHEAAVLLMEEARHFLQYEIGLSNAKWSQEPTETIKNHIKIENCSKVSTPLNETQNISKNKTANESLFNDSLLENVSNIKEGVDSWCSSFDGTNLNVNNSDLIETSLEADYKTPLSCKRIRHDNQSSCSTDLFTKTPMKKSLKFNSEPKAFEIINVCGHKDLFDCFVNELLQQKEIAIAIGCEKINNEKRVIGENLLNVNKSCKEEFVYKLSKVTAISICWDELTVYYLNMEECDNVTKDSKRNLLKVMCENEKLMVRMFDAKEHIRMLKFACDVDFLAECQDPQIADWLFCPESMEKAMKFPSYALDVLEFWRSEYFTIPRSYAFDIESPISGKIRASTEAFLVWIAMKVLKLRIYYENEILEDIFSLDMKCLKILSEMEITGFGVNLQELQKLADTLKEYTTLIERKAYQLSGKRFSFTSPKEVAKVLGLFTNNKRRINTNKQVLKQQNNPLAELIMQWRKLNSTLTQMIYPLLRQIDNNRIHGCCIIRNATGRISMHEPSLQNVPRDFTFLNPMNNENRNISVRRVFEARDKCVLISADYCQLELRLLAHFTQDRLLCRIMRSNVDVFKSIAAKWNRIDEDNVTDEMRQNAKQICYGIIYGIGMKALAEQMNCTEDEVIEFTETFHRTYPALRKYINTTISKCKETAYVETLSGRRRYLYPIRDQNQAIRSQAERQAVNTTVQGSAADIAKNAMVMIDDKIKEKFKGSRNKPKLVLQLHDEFIYEVPKKYAQMFAKLLRKCMEDSVNLSIPFPVKVQSGRSWGELKLFNCDKSLSNV